MGKFLIRITAILVTIYFFISYYYAQFLGIDILRNTYTLLFELCFVVAVFEEGRYHCRYMRWTALGILLTDCLAHLDYYFNFVSVGVFSILSASILFASCMLSFVLAIRHFYKVNKLKRKKKSYEYKIERD